MTKLTALQVKNAKPDSKLNDGRGLRLETDRNGNKRWIFRFTSPTLGKERYMGLGSAKTVSLQLARELAEEKRPLIVRGIDPIDHRAAATADAQQQQKLSVPFREYAKQYIAAHEATWKNKAHRQNWSASLENHAYPIIGDIPVGEIDTDAVLNVVRPIWNRIPETGARVLGRIRKILSAAKVEGLRSGENPAAWSEHIDQFLPSKKKIGPPVHHPALPYAEIPAFWRSLVADPSPAAKALQFIILTVARYNEGVYAADHEIKPAKSLWIVPKERMKGGLEHHVPLTPGALALVAGRTGFLFPAPLSGDVISDVTLMKVIARHTKTKATTHGFRSTFRDWVGDCTEFDGMLAEAALAHKLGDETELAYRRGDALERRRGLMQAWEDYLNSEPDNLHAPSSADQAQAARQPAVSPMT